MGNAQHQRPLPQYHHLHRKVSQGGKCCSFSALSAVSHSNAGEERVFSMVMKNKNKIKLSSKLENTCRWHTFILTTKLANPELCHVWTSCRGSRKQQRSYHSTKSSYYIVSKEQSHWFLTCLTCSFLTHFDKSLTHFDKKSHSFWQKVSLILILAREVETFPFVQAANNTSKPNPGPVLQYRNQFTHRFRSSFSSGKG